MSSADSLRVRELIFSVRAGEETAFSELVAIYTPMVRGVIARYGVDYDEMFSDACMALYKAVHTYDTEQGEVTFGLYAQICVTHRLLDILRREKGRELKMSDEDIESLSVESGIVTRLIREEESRTLRKSARQLLSELEYSVFTMWLGELKNGEIADRLGKSVKDVENAKARILKKLREGLGTARN